MPTTFTVFSLGVQSDMDADPVSSEGNTLAENAGDLTGLTFGAKLPGARPVGVTATWDAIGIKGLRKDVRGR